MNLPSEAALLRIFVDEPDRHDGRPLHEAVVLKARESGLAGATVFHGTLGFGASSHLHTANILRLSEDLPIVVEIVDTAEKIEGFLPILEPMMAGGLVTVERAQVVHYRHKGEHPKKRERT